MKLVAAESVPTGKDPSKIRFKTISGGKGRPKRRLIVKGVELDPDNIPDHVKPIFKTVKSRGLYRGVTKTSKHGERPRFQVSYFFKDKAMYLGSFANEIQAARMYGEIFILLTLS